MHDPSPAERIVARFRGLANIVLLLGAIVFALAWAMHWPPQAIAPVGLITLTAFLASIISIVIENRITSEEAKR